MMFVVFDLDGTLADHRLRLPFLKSVPKRWDYYFAGCADDIPIRPSIETLLALVDLEHRVEIWTGRPERTRDVTQRWLLKNGIEPALLRHMRPDDDRRPDFVLKHEWLVAEQREPDLVFEDRSRVVDMWRRSGIPCFHVAEGNF